MGKDVLGLVSPPQNGKKRHMDVWVDVLNSVLSTIDTGSRLWKVVFIVYGFVHYVSCMVPQNTLIVLCCVCNTAIQMKYFFSSNYCDIL